MNTRKPTRNELAEARYELELALGKLAAAGDGVTLEQMKDALAGSLVRVIARRALRDVLKSRRKKRRKRRRG